MAQLSVADSAGTAQRCQLFAKLGRELHPGRRYLRSICVLTSAAGLAPVFHRRTSHPDLSTRVSNLMPFSRQADLLRSLPTEAAGWRSYHAMRDARPAA